MRRSRPLLLLVVAALLAGLLPAGVVAAKAPAPPAKPAAAKVVFFAADGMRPDLMETYAAKGVMPTYAKLMATGVKGDNGMVQAFPPNTGVGWYTLATGAYPGEHGSTNNTFFRTGDAFNNRTAAFSGGVLQADTIAEVGRAGRQEGRLGRVGGRLPDDDRAPGPGRRLPQLLLEPRPLDELRRPRPAGRRERVRRPVPALRPRRRRGLDERPGQLQPGEAGHVRHRLVHERLAGRAGDRQRPVRLLRLRLDRTTPSPTTTAFSSSPTRSRRTAARPSRTWARTSGPTSRSRWRTRPARPAAST